MSVASLRTLAIVEAPSETDTVFGGKARSWVQVCALWIDLVPSGHREGGEGNRPVLTETASAIARTTSAVQAGQRITTGGPKWRVVAVTPSAPKTGRMTLSLERTWP